MKLKFRIILIVIQLIILSFVVKFLWEFWSSKGDLNLPLGILGIGIIVIFYLPFLFKQIKQAWFF